MHSDSHWCPPELLEQSDRFRPPELGHRYQVVSTLQAGKECVTVRPTSLSAVGIQQEHNKISRSTQIGIRRNPTDCRIRPPPRALRIPRRQRAAEAGVGCPWPSNTCSHTDPHTGVKSPSGDLRRPPAVQPEVGSRQGADDGLDGVPRDVPRGGDRGWDEDELRQLARMWSEESGRARRVARLTVPMISRRALLVGRNRRRTLRSW